MARDGSRLTGIDVMRAFAVIGVMGFHFGGSLAPQPGIEILVNSLSRHGFYGVSLFFAISGFVITRTIRERDGDIAHMRIGAFYRRRVARLAPAFVLWFALGLLALALAPRASPATKYIVLGSAGINSVFWLSIATMTFNLDLLWVMAHGYNFGLHWGLLWTLSTEEQFYLFFPLVVHIKKFLKNIWFILASMVCLGIATRAIAKLSGIYVIGAIAPLASFDLLAIGVAAALLRPARWSQRLIFCSSVGGLFALMIGFLSPFFIANPLLIGIGTALIMLSCQNGAVFTRAFWRPLARIGRVSYGMYLFHPLVLWVLIPFLHNISYLLALAIFCVATWAAAEISFRFFEQPAARFILGRHPRGWQAAHEERSGLGSPRV